MKKRLSILFTLIIAVVFAGGTVMAESYSVVPWPTRMLNSALFSADLVIEGTILDDGRQGIATVNYEVAVDDVWLGTCEEETIMFNCGLKYTLPRKNDRLILLLAESKGRYYLSRSENSIFIKNPPFNLLFPLSPTEACMVYDGETAGKLKSDMKKALRRLARKGIDISQARGEVSAPYKEKYLARHPEEGQK